MSLTSILLFSTVILSIFPGTLAAPPASELPDVKRWFTINPSNPNNPKIWPNNKLKYKFADNNSKNKLASVVTAGWKLWTDAGVLTSNIDIIESTDNDALTITVTTNANAVTTIGYTGSSRMLFGQGSSYGFLDQTANMAHELGHALGFYHEHQRDDRDAHVTFNCKNLADYQANLDNPDDGFCTNLFAAVNNGWSSQDFIVQPQSFLPTPLNCYGQNYDEDSIMHYPGGAGAKKPKLGHRPVVLADRNGNSFKKNSVPSPADVARTNVMYGPTGGNGKRDVGADCRASARLTRTYTVDPALTSALIETHKSFDFTGTPILSSTLLPFGDESVTPTATIGSGPGTSVPALTSCSLVQTTLSGTIAPGPQTYCTCGEVIAGINTATTDGTVYSICAGTPFPTIASSVLPPVTTTPPAPATTPPPAPTTSLNPSSVCIHVFTDPPVSTASCTTSVASTVTPLPDGAWSCYTSEFTICLCQADGEGQPCETLAEIEAGG